jgi:multifunctional 2-oxoglutarate metabolism enzyme
VKVVQTLVQVILPEMGESVAEGSVTSWRKKPGDFVAAGEPLVDVTTDKVDVEIPSPAKGKLVRIVAGEGTTVAVGALLAEIDIAASDGKAASPQLDVQAQTTSQSPALKATPPKPQVAPQGREATTKAVPQTPTPRGVRASPSARRAAAQRGISLDRVTPSVPGEVIRRTDIDNVIGTVKPASPATAKPSTVPSPTAATLAEKTLPLRGAAASLAEHMERSLGIPTATSFRTVEVDVLDSRRRELNAALRAAGRSEKISFTHLIAFAIARAVSAVPTMAVSYRHTPEGPQRVERGVHLGLAVDVRRNDGSRMLLVPVVRDADKLDFAAFHRAYEALVEKARGGSLAPSDLSGATLTLTNPGGIGTLASVPRLMAGQGTIVAAGAIDYPPGLRALGPATLRNLSVSKVMTLTSTYDHRIIQGAESGEFLRRIDQLLAGSDGFYESVFSSLGLAAPGQAVPSPPETLVAPAADREIARAAAAGVALITRYRAHGVNAAHLDPLADASPMDPALEPASLGLDHALMQRVPATVLRVYAPGDNLAEVLSSLRDTYCSTIAYEVEHISNHEQRSWLRQQIESGAHRQPLSRERKLELLDQLTRVESFERYLRKTFLGQKTFSIEGLDVMVPMLEQALVMLASEGTPEVRLGMAHRGRLAVITHVVDRPYEEVLEEFERAQERGLVTGEGDVTGDVKYHQGAAGTYETPSGKKIRVVLANNPSHLEAVDSVVEGQTRAVQTDRKPNIATVDRRKAAAILIHGDAAFDGQGVVAEVFNLQGLEGYSTGGTLHIIANNQIGFTTLPTQGRSTRYASDPAKGFDVPIIHVNADDLEAAIAAVVLAVEYRRKFHRDAVIDLIGYRRFGHNEADEPAYTQPLMYERIAVHPTAREIFARRLVEEGTVSSDEIDASLALAQDRVKSARAAAKNRIQTAARENKPRSSESANGSVVQTSVPLQTLQALNAALLLVPSGFTIHPKLARQLERRREALAPTGEIDWGLGEALAFASLLADGVPIRLTGQDTERGTFSHRHVVLFDAKTGTEFVPMQHLDSAKASFEIYNSPLSEYAVLGFEYGYSAEAPGALVLWEAQFGDFSNGAQIIIDQFMAGGRVKWQQTSRLTLLLPHGYEGAGPEHSSARLERFLQLAADGNFRIANPTTPAQYFHLLRDQAKSRLARPLVVMTPKSLLRLPAASSHATDFSDGAFMPVLDDPTVSDRDKIRRLALCSGKIYYDLIASPKRAENLELAIARVELLEPFPFDRVLEIVASYPNIRQVTWVQEEPKNMGARAFVSRRIRERLIPRGIIYDYIGRPDRASPSEGYPGAHAVEQERIVNEVIL